MTGTCRLCGDTGWIDVLDCDDYGYELPCPRGCPMPELPPVADDEEVPS
jgi:hypothetical protein